MSSAAAPDQASDAIQPKAPAFGMMPEHRRAASAKPLSDSASPRQQVLHSSTVSAPLAQPPLSMAQQAAASGSLGLPLQTVGAPASGVQYICSTQLALILTPATEHADEECCNNLLDHASPRQPDALPSAVSEKVSAQLDTEIQGSASDPADDLAKAGLLAADEMSGTEADLLDASDPETAASAAPVSQAAASSSPALATDKESSDTPGMIIISSDVPDTEVLTSGEHELDTGVKTSELLVPDVTSSGISDTKVMEAVVPGVSADFRDSSRGPDTAVVSAGVPESKPLPPSAPDTKLVMLGVPDTEVAMSGMPDTVPESEDGSGALTPSPAAPPAAKQQATSADLKARSLSQAASDQVSQAQGFSILLVCFVP